MRRRLLCATILAALFAAVALPLARARAAQAGGCAQSAANQFGDPDLYCIDLLPGAGIDDATGIARLLPPATPYGIAVSPAGEQLYDVELTLRDLPAPQSLGRFTAYVAWATTPQLTREVKLGTVTNGQARFGTVPFDRFLVIITAEATAAVTQRTGRPVLRGTSASVRMQPHDLAFLLAGLLDRGAAGATAAASAHDHAGHAMADTGGWTAPPMYPGVSMPPALMTLRPDVASYAPAGDDAPLARPRELVRLADGAALDLVAAPVTRIIFGRRVTMLGFNGQYPGPLIVVDEQTTITVRFVNRTDFPTAVHWHGIRLDNRFDGVPHVTQDPVAPGASFDYRITFPDAGVYWYHPHHREDVLQDLGLYGNLLVRSRDPGYLGPMHREAILMLDDLLVAESGLVGHGLESPTHAVMGRFGNVLLVNGEPRWDTQVARGEVIRLALTNVSSTRVFNLSFAGEGTAPAGVRMKLVASDLGRYEREHWVDTITISPAERFIVDVRFDEPGTVSLVNRVRAIDHIQARFFEEKTELGRLTVAAAPASPDHGASFGVLAARAAVTDEFERYRAHMARAVDHELVVTLQPGDLPFPLRPLMNFESVYRNPVEWTGTMPEMDWVVSGRQAQWLLRDTRTGRINMDINWRFRVGDVVKLRIVNDRQSLHAMHHPMHIHGQRFLVLSTNGVANRHRVWKDTVLLPAGYVAELLLEITNPGKWMLHCHVAEHIETGMRMVFEVEP